MAHGRRPCAIRPPVIPIATIAHRKNGNAHAIISKLNIGTVTSPVLSASEHCQCKILTHYIENTLPNDH